MFCQSAVRVEDSSQIGEVRREAQRRAAECGFSEADAGRASIVATELATNLHRYASGGGEVLVRTYEIANSSGLELIAIDRGPGMADPARCLEDGYSTGGTPGNGLGAVRRLSTEFDLYSQPERGTIVLARIERPTLRSAAPSFQWGVINRPAPYETQCGDTWRIVQRDGEISLMVADGLGHGPLAAQAADLAGKVFESSPGQSTAEFLVSADRQMRGTRGAAVAVVRLDAALQKLRFSGIGNIAGSIRGNLASPAKGLVSHNGIVGGGMPRMQQFDYDCAAGSLLTVHSDGLKTRWTLDAYAGLMGRHPAVIAGILYRDFRREKDDVTVCVLRTSGAAA